MPLPSAQSQSITTAADQANPSLNALRRQVVRAPADRLALHDIAAHALIGHRIAAALRVVLRALAITPSEPGTQQLYALALLRLADENKIPSAGEFMMRNWTGPRPWRRFVERNGDERLTAEAILSRFAQSGDPTLFLNLGAARLALGRIESALAAFHRALVLSPSYLEALNNLAATHSEALDRSKGEVWLERGLSVAPDYAEGWNNLASLLLHAGEPEAASKAAEQALRCRPGWAEPTWHLALAILARGDFERGFALYEARFGLASDKFAPSVNEAWNGNYSALGDAIVVRAEQGLGDMIQFVRYLPELARRGFSVTLECPASLEPLLASVAGVTGIISLNSQLPVGTRQVALMSLPHLMGTRLDTVPATVPYLRAPAPLRRAWGERLRGLKRPLIGFCWQGNPAFRRDRERSPGFAALRSLLEHEGATFLGLVREPSPEALAEPRLRHLGPGFKDFADTAACLEELDLVITSDTALAHLAGALAKPTYLLLHHAPDWRWLEERTDSPWYPTMRLFRQKRPGDWTAVIAAIRQALSA